MTNIRLFFTLVLFSLILSSCNKWLDLKPETQVDADELFTTEAGFQESLNGLYSRISNGDLYGRELTIGLPEVLAQNYTIAFNDTYRYHQSGLFNYSDRFFIVRKDSLWSGFYNAIANSNIILNRIDTAKGVFTGNNYGLIKAEALGLRAYLHFDALRLFSPSYKSAPNAPAIPYVTTYSKTVTPLSTVNTLLEKVIADLEQAKALLSAIDNIRSPSYIVGYTGPPEETDATEESDRTFFMQNRRHRMNYYAVCATLARVYLYKEDKPKALSNALEVINSNKFPWTRAADFQNSLEAEKDRILYPELIMGWYIPGRTIEIERRFQSGVTGLMIGTSAGESLFETGGVGAEDMRFKEWLRSRVITGGTAFEIQKYRRATENRHYQMAPAIRLSEMYYIAAECSYSTNSATALSYFNTVRNNRGIIQPLTVGSENEFLSALVRECRKEWLAEGQIFYMYKRLNRPIQTQAGLEIAPSDKIFVLTKPDNEIIYGGR